MKDSFSKQIEALQGEIIAAIRNLLKEYGKSEIEIPNTVDAIYIITITIKTIRLWQQ